MLCRRGAAGWRELLFVKDQTERGLIDETC